MYIDDFIYKIKNFLFGFISKQRKYENTNTRTVFEEKRAFVASFNGVCVSYCVGIKNNKNTADGKLWEMFMSALLNAVYRSYGKICLCYEGNSFKEPFKFFL